MELEKCNYSESQMKYEQKSISLDKLNDLDNEHIYDTVPFSSSSSRSSSSSLTKISSKSQLSNFNQSTLNNYDHVSLILHQMKKTYNKISLILNWTTVYNSDWASKADYVICTEHWLKFMPIS